MAEKKPKQYRQPNPYILFLKDKMKNKGNKPVTEMMKKIGEEWKKLEEPEKKKWKNMAEKSKPIEYKPRKSKSPKSKTKTKRKPGAYALFVKDKMKNRGNKPVTEMMKKIGEEWKKLEEPEKKKWKNMAEKL